MALSPGGLGALGGLGQAMQNLAPMYMRLQERKQDLALRQEELEKEKQERDMQQRMRLLQIAVTSGNQEFIETSVDGLAAHFATDGIDLSQIDWRDRKAEAGKAYLKLWKKYEDDNDLEALRTGIMGVNSEFPKTEAVFKDQLGLFKQEQQGVQKEGARLDAEQNKFLRADFQTEAERRQGLGQMSTLGTPGPGLGVGTGQQPLGPPTVDLGGGREPLWRGQEEVEEPTTKQVWDNTIDQYVQKTQAEINEDLQANPNRYGKTQKDMLALQKAGAPSITQIMGVEKFGIQKEKDAAEIRTNLMKVEKDNQDYFSTNAHFFNDFNKQNEVAYWDSGLSAGKQEQRFYDEEVKIFKLPPKLIKDGWTPKKIQERARRTGMTVEEILRKIGAL